MDLKVAHIIQVKISAEKKDMFITIFGCKLNENPADQHVRDPSFQD